MGDASSTDSSKAWLLLDEDDRKWLIHFITTEAEKKESSVINGYHIWSNWIADCRRKARAMRAAIELLSGSV